MSIFSKYRPLVHLLAATLLLPLVCACFSNNYDENCDQIGTPTPETTTPQQYINLSIVVSSGNEGTMRAPSGGEYGDGYEEGRTDESKVEGITLMLYKVENDTKGINTLTDDYTLSYIKYYHVKKAENITHDQHDNNKTDEITYTTGDQLLEDLDLTKTYRAIVVANLDLTEKFKVGDKIINIVEHKVDYIYDENCTGIRIDASNFVMSLETEAPVITFGKPTSTTTSASGQTIEKYEFNNIHIERLAARMDFWAKGASYDKDYEGYVYDVKAEDGTVCKDKFVLTAITPFNLSDAQEYLFKRIYKNKNEGAKDYYLDKEDETNITTDKENWYNCVIDPLTRTKNSEPTFMKTNYALSDVFDTNKNKTVKMPMSEFQLSQKWNSALEPNHFEPNNTTDKGDNIIVCYPKENTLWKNSLLFYYATGLCIEGYYYEEGWDEENAPETKIKHLVYCGFLRHQGETNSTSYYKIYSKDELVNEDGSLTEKANELKSEFPMNYGVVRNNIYRISIDNITQKKDEDPEITLKIKVKRWDTFTHDIIYM